MENFIEESQEKIKKILALLKLELSENNLEALLLMINLRRGIVEYLSENHSEVEQIRPLLIQIEQLKETYDDVIKYVRIKDFDVYWEKLRKK